jgi:hypothetical protein
MTFQKQAMFLSTGKEASKLVEPLRSKYSQTVGTTEAVNVFQICT